MLRDAPIKSIFSTNTSLEIDSVPLPRILEVIEYIPFLSLPEKGGLSINKLAVTLGSFLFSTINTLRPFFS